MHREIDQKPLFEALQNLGIDAEIVSTGGGYYAVNVPVNNSVKVMAADLVAEIFSTKDVDFIATLATAQSVKVLAKTIADFVRLNK